MRTGLIAVMFLMPLIVLETGSHLTYQHWWSWKKKQPTNKASHSSPRKFFRLFLCGQHLLRDNTALDSCYWKSALILSSTVFKFPMPTFSLEAFAGRVFHSSIYLFIGVIHFWVQEDNNSGERQGKEDFWALRYADTQASSAISSHFLAVIRFMSLSSSVLSKGLHLQD